MIIVGITGGIGMGKSTIAGQFAQLGASVCSADDVVHALLAEGGGAVRKVAELFPECMEGHRVSREKLGRCVFNNPRALKKLEDVLHPLVMREEMRFAAEQQKLGTKTVVLDIPLLFETGAEKRCDYTVVVTAPHFVQRNRVLKRRGMTEERLVSIMERQMPEREKIMRADFVVHSGMGKAYSFQEVKQIMREIT